MRMEIESQKEAKFCSWSVGLTLHITTSAFIDVV